MFILAWGGAGLGMQVVKRLKTILPKGRRRELSEMRFPETSTAISHASEIAHNSLK